MPFKTTGTRETRQLLETLLLGKTSDSQALGMLSGKNIHLGKWRPALLCYLLRVQMILTQLGKENT